MSCNPFSEVFRKAFFKDVLCHALYLPQSSKEYPERIKKFMFALNKFLRTSGQAPILYQSYTFDEHNLFEYALFLRGYMRDSQRVLASLKQEHACDPRLINLFEASSEYIVACNHQLNDKRIFDNNVGYHFWKIDLQKGLQNAHYLPQEADEKRHNLFLFMPFRITNDEHTLTKWLYSNMKDTLNNQDIFGNIVDTFVTYYPIQKSRSSNITSLLKTIHLKNYFEKQDMDFILKHWINFIATDIKIDDNYKVITANKYTTEQLNKNLSNISIFSYCAGTANAQRCINALYHIGKQIYDKQIIEKALQNIFIVSYGYLPTQNHSLYSGAHFYSNALNDENQREPFVNLNNHTLYEKTKCTKNIPARFTVMPDGRNYVISLRLVQPITFFENGKIITLTDGEFGHNMANVNTPNIHNPSSHTIFKSVLENISMGIRGKNVFYQHKNTYNLPTTTFLYPIEKIR